MDKTDWLKARKKGLGGSDIGAIVGVNPYKTPLQVWEEKRSESIEQFDNESMYWGRKLEPVIRQRYSDETGREVLVPTEILVHPKYDFMLANIDGFTRDKRIIEIKTSAYPNGFGEPGTDEIPLHYLYQIFHYMIVTGYSVADVPVLIGGRDFRIYEVQADDELQQMIIAKEAEFWELVKSGVPPAPVNYADVVRLYRKSEAKEVMASAEVETWVEGLKRIRADMKTLEANEEEVKRRIMEAMKEADTLTDPAGKVLATWKQGKGVKRFSSSALRSSEPEIYNKYLIEGESPRRFLLKGEKP
jgi:putative phage-type endonuclease